MIKNVTVIIDKFIVLLSDNKVEETIAGIINKIIKGLVMPPVKKRSVANWIRSYIKYKVELILFNRFFLILNCKNIFVKVPKKIIRKQ